MWIIQLILAWLFLIFMFRLMIGFGGKRDSSDRPTTGSGPGPEDSDSGYLRNNPDALRPDIEDEFDPTDYM